MIVGGVAPGPGDGVARALTATPAGVESAAMKLWLTPVPSRLARPIEYNGAPFVHQTYALSTATLSGLPAKMKNWLTPVPSRLARAMVAELTFAQ